MAPVGIALIGSGNFIRDQHLVGDCPRPGLIAPAVEATNCVILNAIYSRSKKSADVVIKGKLEDSRIYSEDQGSGRGYEALLARDDIDAVLIALPILVQPDFIKKALQAGKHVLSEKPIAKDYETAKELIGWYHRRIETKNVFWGVGENYRFIDSLLYGASIVKSGVLGRISTFHTHLFANVKGGNLSFETAWRQKPEYQGGFLLDGGVHFIAGTRLMLGPSNPITRLSAFTKLTRSHLPPVDTVDAIMKTETGIIGSFSVSLGSSTSGSEYTVTGENGYVSVIRGTAGTGGGALVGSMSSWVVSQVIGEHEIKKEFPSEGTGVPQEVASWAQSLSSGKALDEMLSPGNALMDLELIEKMLRSGENDGQSMKIDR